MGEELAGNVAMRIWPDALALAHGVADWLTDLALAQPGRFSICLSGGSTPKLLYQTLAERQHFPWGRVHWFWGDELFVAQDDPLSYYRMVREALLDQAPIPAENIHPFPILATPADSALAYEQELQAFYGDTVLELPLFDVTLLGLGSDGHTASLFPGTPVLDEKTRWAKEVLGAKPEPRLTLTYPALNHSREVAFLVSGSDKQAILAELRAGNTTAPASGIRPIGNLNWFVTASALPAVV